MTSPSSPNTAFYYPEALFPNRSQIIPLQRLAKGIAKVLNKSKHSHAVYSATGFCILAPNGKNTNMLNQSTSGGQDKLALVTNYHVIADPNTLITRKDLVDLINDQIEVFFDCIEYENKDLRHKRNSIVKLDTNIYFNFSQKDDWVCIGLRVTKETMSNLTMADLDGCSETSNSSDDLVLIEPEPLPLSTFIPSCNQIIQICGHPKGGKLQQSFDKIESYLPVEGTIFHSVSTDQGSSG